ncbi:MAG TPA: PadR family transcriptional regulator [Thermoanaerobaculia bacterium]|nr:PadR family transcriptional regulator [Thermoanaerobaculia bacterium]
MKSKQTPDRRSDPQPPPRIGELERLILLAALRVAASDPDNVYGVAIRREILDRTGRDIAPGAIYTALERMERRGLVASRFGEPTPVRGGKRKRLYTVLPAAVRSVERSLGALRQLAGDPAAGTSWS